MAKIEQCDVCCGSGDYPVINKLGQDLYHITCPQCDGVGDVDVEADVEVEEPNLPPPSSAAFIKSVDEMRTYIERNWR